MIIINFIKKYGTIGLIVGVALIVLGQFTFEWIAWLGVATLTPIILLLMGYAVKNTINDIRGGS